MHPTYLTDVLGLGMTIQGIFVYLTTIADSCIDGSSTMELVLLSGQPLTWLV